MLAATDEVLVDVPPSDPPLRIPAGLAGDQILFERVLDEFNRGLDTLAEPDSIRDAIARAALRPRTRPCSAAPLR